MTDLVYCKRCILDSAVDDISFDPEGICSYCALHDKLDADNPRGAEGERRLAATVQEIKKAGEGKRYDCIVGLSGGTDSTYLLYLTKKWGLRPLAVFVDNGWASEISVSNVKACLDILKVDLRTWVIDWEEMAKIHRSFLKACVPWPDGTTDEAITSALYRIAAEEKVKYVLIGHDFRAEGKQPRRWTYVDGRMIRAVALRFEGLRLKHFPNLTISRLLYAGMVKRIKNLRPYWYIDYDKEKAKAIIQKELGWRDYGGHHHESIFTRFLIGYWLPEKFGIDKRKITYSAYVRSGRITREEALKKIAEPHYEESRRQEDVEYVLQKLDLPRAQFEKILESPNRSFRDYPTYLTLYERLKPLVHFVFRYLLPFKPMMFYEDGVKRHPSRMAPPPTVGTESKYPSAIT